MNGLSLPEFFTFLPLIEFYGFSFWEILVVFPLVVSVVFIVVMATSRSFTKRFEYARTERIIAKSFFDNARKVTIYPTTKLEIVQSRWTKKELIQLARKNDIKGFSRMSKDELISSLSAAGTLL